MNSPTAESRTGTVATSGRDPIEAWLDLFERTLNLPEPKRAALRAELEDHLRSRVDDLQIAGDTETEAVRRAVAELGETVELASRFREALKPKRKGWIMTTGITTLVAGLAIGAASLTGSNALPNSTAATEQSGMEQAGAADAKMPAFEISPADPELRSYSLAAVALGGELLREDHIRLTEMIPEFAGVHGFQILETRLIARASDEEHAKLVWIIKILGEERRERLAEMRAAEAEQAAERERVTEERERQLASRLAELREEYEVAKDEMLRHHYQHSLAQATPMRTSDEADPVSYATAVAERETSLAEIQLELKMLQTRVERLQHMMLDLEFDRGG